MASNCVWLRNWTSSNKKNQPCPVFLRGLPYRDQNVSQVHIEIPVVRKPFGRGRIQ